MIQMCCISALSTQSRHELVHLPFEDVAPLISEASSGLTADGSNRYLTSRGSSCVCNHPGSDTMTVLKILLA